MTYIAAILLSMNVGVPQGHAPHRRHLSYIMPDHPIKPHGAARFGNNLSHMSIESQIRARQLGNETYKIYQDMVGKNRAQVSGQSQIQYQVKGN